MPFLTTQCPVHTIHFMSTEGRISSFLRVAPSNWMLILEVLIIAYLDAMFEAVELPAGIADLNPCLADVDGKALSHDE